MKCKTPKRFTISICHSLSIYTFIREALTNMVRTSCKAKEFDLHGFPDVSTIVMAIKQNQSDGRFQSHAAYEVCCPFPDGCLVIPDSHIEEWSKTDWADAMAALLKKHNESHNTKKHTVASQAGQASKKKAKASSQGKALDTIEDDEVKTLEDFDTKISEGEKLEFPGGSFLTSGETSEGRLWVYAEKDLNIVKHTTCFSFGSGTWEEGDDAQKLTEDADAPWLLFALPDSKALVQLETDPKSSIPDTVKEYGKEHAGTTMTLEELLLDFERLGEAPRYKQHPPPFPGAIDS